MDNLPYLSLNRFLRDKFGEKTIKLSVDAGFTCPNRDGKLSTKGCIFCSSGGSGDFAGSRNLSITKQLESQKELLSKKWSSAKYIAYFQAFTNTYAPVEVLRKKYEEAIGFDGVVALAVATRPDCITEEIALLLEELNKKVYVWAELGLQTSNEKSAEYINRGYKTSVYSSAIELLHKHGIDVVTHIIFGLPNETEEDMLKSVKFAVKSKTDGIKLQLLHVLENTPLGEIYKEKPFHVLTKEEYTDLVCRALEIIPNTIVIHRLTGDGNKNELIEPKWSLNKKDVLNTINKKLSKKYNNI